MPLEGAYYTNIRKCEETHRVTLPKPYREQRKSLAKHLDTGDMLAMILWSSRKSAERYDAERLRVRSILVREGLL